MPVWRTLPFEKLKPWELITFNAWRDMHMNTIRHTHAAPPVYTPWTPPAIMWPNGLVFMWTGGAPRNSSRRHVNVALLREGFDRLPLSTRSKEIDHMIYRSVPLRKREIPHIWARCERVLCAIDKASLAKQAWGLKELFEEVWKQEEATS